MRIFALHKHVVMAFDFVDNKDTLGTISVLDKSLENTAAIVLVTKLGVLVTDKFDAFFDELVLLRVRDFSFFHVQFGVVDTQLLNQIRNFLLLATI